MRGKLALSTPLGRDTSASGARHVRIWYMVHPHLGRGSLTGIGDGLANCVSGSTCLWKKQKRLGLLGDWKGGDGLELGKGLRPRWRRFSGARRGKQRWETFSCWSRICLPSFVFGWGWIGGQGKGLLPVLLTHPSPLSVFQNCCGRWRGCAISCGSNTPC